MSASLWKKTLTWRWKVALALLTLAFAGIITRAYWLEAVSKSLVFSTPLAQSDAIVIENLDAEYLLFERARQLQTAGLGTRILVPVPIDPDAGRPNVVSVKITAVLCEIARVQHAEFVPVRIEEPISIGVARQLAAKLDEEEVKSAIIVASGFRSRRTYLIYEAVCSPYGIRVECSPVFGRRRPDNWTRSWHGVEEVLEQLVKLHYYRWVVLSYGPLCNSVSRF